MKYSQTKLLNMATEFLGGGTAFCGWVLELDDGKKLKAKDFADACVSAKDGVFKFSCAAGDCRAEWVFSKLSDGCVSVRAKFEAAGQTCRVRKIIYNFKVSGRGGGSAMLHNLFDSGIRPLAEIVGVQESRFFLSVLGGDGGCDITFANSLQSKFFSRMTLKKAKKNLLVSFETVIPLSYCQDVSGEELLIVCKGAAEALEKCAALSQNSDAKKECPPLIGWSSWDYYYTSADEKAVKENVDFISEDVFLSEKIKYIQLDDGWQQREGDWKEGARFPSGLKRLTEYIQDKGYTAGIWTAPTRLHNLCATVMRRHDFLIRDGYGDPITDEDHYVLDPTHPDGEKFLTETFTYLKECGFGFYKIDFLSNLLNADYFYDKTAGPYDALRKLITIIRKCVGEGSHIMGCALPYGTGGGYVDSRRTGLDIHNTYKHIVKCTECFVPQFASHGKIYRGDLDYLVVRGKDTSGESITNVLNPFEGKYKATPSNAFRWRDGGDFSFSEAKMWCATLLLSGSSLFLGDRLSALNDKGLELVKKTLLAADFEAAVPLTINGDGLPEVWYKRRNGGLYILNYSNSPKEYSLPVDNLPSQAAKYADIFSDAEYKQVNGIIKLTLSGRDCVALKQSF